MSTHRTGGQRRLDSRWPHVVVLDPYTAGLAVARRMNRLGARVTMLVDPLDPFVDRTRGVRSIVTPFGHDGSNWAEILPDILSPGEEAVALPATDRSCEMLLGAAGSLPDNLHMFERGSTAHLSLMNKERADEVARSAGVPVPWTAMVNDSGDIEQAVSEAPWPCVAKPVLSHEWRERYGGERAFLVQGPHEARERMICPLHDGIAMMLCQYISGGDDDVEEAIVVRLTDGSYPVQFGCHKLRQHPRGFGATTVGESSNMPETMSLAKRVLDEAGFVGVAGVEAKRHSPPQESAGSWR